MWISWTSLNIYFSKVYQKALLQAVQMQEPLNAGTLQWTQPLLPFALTVCWWKADVVFSLFSFSSVLILSSWSTQKPHAAFSKFYKWWCFFHYHRGPVLWGWIWTSVTARRDEKRGYGQEKRLRKKGMTSWPRVSSIHSFHTQLASQMAFSECRLWGLSETRPSFCLRRHSALNVRSLLRRAGHGCLPFFLPLRMLKHPQNFLKWKSRWRMTCRHELNFCLVTFDETLWGAAYWLDKSLHGVFCREWSLWWLYWMLCGCSLLLTQPSLFLRL